MSSAAETLLLPEGGVRLHRRHFVALAVLGGLGALGLPARAASMRARLVGRYVYVGGERERAARDKAIDDVVADMNIIVRSIARSRLKAANPIPRKVAIAISDRTITVTLDSRVYQAPADGSPVKVKGITGDELELRYHLDERELRQEFTGDSGGRNNRFRPMGDDRVRIKVRVHSDQLPKPLVYQLTYGTRR
jgi:hypothetical protein